MLCMIFYILHSCVPFNQNHLTILAVHQLTKSLGAEGSGLPEGAVALCILPVTLDTPMNRKWMAKADKSTWTPLEFIGELFHGWLTTGVERPPTGSLVKLVTTDGVTATEVL